MRLCVRGWKLRMSPCVAVQKQYAYNQAAISTEKQTFLNDVLMPAAISFFSDTLKVFPVTGTIGMLQCLYLF